ncbi:MAG: hypothetical protein KF871_13910 [Hydrogenophaga sp.]|uniref:hypothetical protein n=1 Tax=Hydrogenophaga sp. TaxID=1904254 RepID=UPI001DB69FC6|nr:hypothetical protein [Hydrogenophaga sp.]MBX3610981.1 hypothetical protein [Hydrogenophaga sp.]
MSRQVIDTPAAVAKVLNDDGALLPPASRCDVLSKPAAKVQCLVCNSPAMRKQDPSVVVVLMGASRHDQREVASAFERLLGDGQGAIRSEPVSLRVLQSGGITLLLAPWAAREDVRGVVHSLSSSLEPERVTIDGSQVQEQGVVMVHGPGSQGDVAVEIRRSLQAFVADAHPLWRNALRLISGREETRTWQLPLGCTVTERQEGRHVCWVVGFEAMSRLERAAELVDARLDMGKDHLLTRYVRDEDDFGETCVPTIALMAANTSREARTQMARLLQHTLYLVGRLGFAPSGPAELSDRAVAY